MGCAAPFSGSLSYREEGGRPYCDPCYTATVLPRCAGCTQPITDRALRAMDQQWHVTCFTCQVRQHLLHLVLGLKFHILAVRMANSTRQKVF